MKKTIKCLIGVALGFLSLEARADLSTQTQHITGDWSRGLTTDFEVLRVEVNSDPSSVTVYFCDKKTYVESNRYCQYSAKVVAQYNSLIDSFYSSTYSDLNGIYGHHFLPLSILTVIPNSQNTNQDYIQFTEDPFSLHPDNAGSGMSAVYTRI